MDGFMDGFSELQLCWARLSLAVQNHCCCNRMDAMGVCVGSHESNVRGRNDVSLNTSVKLVGTSTRRGLQYV